ncbi:uncharacterized protein LOC117176727 [Belonocnema kinseyi]|uniref:uncharacterized protein LOC117176727 n=1 Tax=Belonocnema kinseyi TaxID=2817044 RepID=UPI00143D8602|nr:uncharacterized protein LOC117176727 [Belonocnema kinseyi]
MEDSKSGVGSFIYFGIEGQLQNFINKNLHEDAVIELQVHADTMRVPKSGTDNFWVLAGKVHHDPDIYNPFQIAIFQGQNKPKSPQLFLDRFINEFNELQSNGIPISGKRFDIQLKSIITDTPARAYLKNTLGHGGIYACERCTVKGEKVDNTTVYPVTDDPERTDISFRKL